MDKADLALAKYTFMYRLGGKVKNSEFYKLEPYLEGPVGLLVVQDLQEYDSDHKKLWRALMFWPVSKAEILFDERIAAPEWSDVDSVAATALGFFTLQDGDTDSEYFDGYSAEQLAWRDEHAEQVGILRYKDESDDNSESLAHLRIP